MREQNLVGYLRRLDEPEAANRIAELEAENAALKKDNEAAWATNRAIDKARIEDRAKWEKDAATDKPLLVRATFQLAKWHEFYGEHCNTPSFCNVLPPSGDVELQEDIAESIGKGCREIAIDVARKEAP